MVNKAKKIIIWQMISIIIYHLSFIVSACTSPSTYHHNDGLVFGTTYSIKYESSSDMQQQIEEALQQVDNALSMFNDSSVISAINRGESIIPPTAEGDMFLDVFQLAERVSQDTNGAFDITVAPLVNAWGFGFRNGSMPDSAAVDSMLQFIGHEKVMFWTDSDRRGISKSDPRVMLDCSAIAKGYGVDAVANMLRSNGVQNFMVEIGGEVVTQGCNPQGSQWHIGVTRPTDDTLSVSGELQTVLTVSDMAMATSGNYRNFYYSGGRKLAHTIDPHTGYPVQHELLSATVLAPTCAVADAYATAFMVMGLKHAQELLSRHEELAAYLIYTDSTGEYHTWQSPAMDTMIANP
ncbi:MAG: FAD:protein FMN transferase [Prevotella sp.]|nr:FAD:protein FMN transferase [Prevotella sp.]